MLEWEIEAKKALYFIPVCNLLCSHIHSTQFLRIYIGYLLLFLFFSAHFCGNTSSDKTTYINHSPRHVIWFNCSMGIPWNCSQWELCTHTHAHAAYIRHIGQRELLKYKIQPFTLNRFRDDCLTADYPICNGIYHMIRMSYVVWCSAEEKKRWYLIHLLFDFSTSKEWKKNERVERKMFENLLSSEVANKDSHNK